ncbi:MAG: stage II sporulation protein R [Clostridiales bacterium GWB2_37_7]|nr:MAG: stage II sporulation protein R [Clostridiales bacterium GWB2_37_7]
MKKAGPFLLVLFFTFGIINYVYINADRELSDVADKLIRLHVVANSDSVEDQDLKRKVRDEVIKQMSPSFEGLKDVSQVKQVILDNLSLIEQTAAKVVAEAQKGYGVKVVFDNFDFPTKEYGSLTLPAGNYQALKIVLGKGEGQNWWCVMFPPLCFIDIAHGVVPKQTMEQLKLSLSEEEYRLLTSAKTEEEVPIKLKFKVVEIVRSMNMRMAKIGQLFKFN